MSPSTSSLESSHGTPRVLCHTAGSARGPGSFVMLWPHLSPGGPSGSAPMEILHSFFHPTLHPPSQPAHPANLLCAKLCARVRNTEKTKTWFLAPKGLTLSGGDRQVNDSYCVALCSTAEQQTWGKVVRKRWQTEVVKHQQETGRHKAGEGWGAQAGGQAPGSGSVPRATGTTWLHIDEREWTQSPVVTNFRSQPHSPQFSTSLPTFACGQCPLPSQAPQGASFIAPFAHQFPEMQDAK